MKLEEVPTDMLSESLLAVQDLRRKYKGEPMVTEYAALTYEDAWAIEKCPLCQFDAYMQGKTIREVDLDGHCGGNCPWFWFTGMDCLENGYDRPIPDRLARISRWEAAINAELARRRE